MVMTSRLTVFPYVTLRDVTCLDASVPCSYAPWICFLLEPGLNLITYPQKLTLWTSKVLNGKRLLSF